MKPLRKISTNKSTTFGETRRNCRPVEKKIESFGLPSGKFDLEIAAKVWITITTSTRIHNHRSWEADFPTRTRAEE